MHQHAALSKLAFGMSGVAFFCVLGCIGAGMNIKAYFDCLESRQHWHSKIEQDKAGEQAEATANSYDILTNPRSRFNYEERRLAAIRQRLFATVTMSLFFGGLFCWGWRGWKRISLNNTG